MRVRLPGSRRLPGSHSANSAGRPTEGARLQHPREGRTPGPHGLFRTVPRICCTLKNSCRDMLEMNVFNLRGTWFSAHFPRFAAGCRTFPPYPCMKSSRCRDDGEMYGKGLALTLACTSPLFLQPAVHFARFLAAGFTPAMHFDQFLAGSRALRLIPCGRTHPRRALPGFSCRLPCTSPVSLQGRNFVQGKRGSARQKARQRPVSACTSAVFLQLAVHFARFLARVRSNARIRGKCTASRGNRGEVHGRSATAHPSSRALPQNSAT